MSDAFDRCPVCKQNFKDCPHSYAEAIQRLNTQTLAATINKLVDARLRKHGLIP